MIGYVLRRALASLALLFVVSIVVFVVLRAIPGDPTLSILGNAHDLSPVARATVRHELGLDQSIVSQYADWLSGLVQGDLGTSFYSQHSVSSIMGERIAPTIELAIASMFWALLFAIPGAIYAALHPGSILERLTSASATIGIAAPPFLIGILLITVFSTKLGILPSRGYVAFTEDPVKSLEFVLLPSITLGLSAGAPILRFLRASLVDEMNAPYMRTAEGKGLLWRPAVLRHALPNAVTPALTVAGLTVGYLLGGIVAVEFVFGWPGLGALMVQSVEQRDYGVLQTAVLFAAGAFLLTMLVVDLVTGVIDPRVRVGSHGGR
ncbi:MAG: ABC transporter permease [Solirubrobacterales bacterium]